MPRLRPLRRFHLRLSAKCLYPAARFRSRSANQKVERGGLPSAGEGREKRGELRNTSHLVAVRSHNGNGRTLTLLSNFMLLRFNLSRFWTLLLSAVVVAWLMLAPLPAQAGLTDDRYDGDIFALYAGNGSLVPPKLTLADSLKQEKATLLVFYTDDSSDCKQYSTVVSQLQAFYGRVTDILAIRVDSLPVKSQFGPTEAGYYYQGFVPQTVVFDQSGKMRFNEKGSIAFEQVDDVFRTMFDLLPRSQSVPLKRRQVNEVNTELVPATPAKK
jgi:hypothetical protein